MHIRSPNAMSIVPKLVLPARWISLLFSIQQPTLFCRATVHFVSNVTQSSSPILSKLLGLRAVWLQCTAKENVLTSQHMQRSKICITCLWDLSFYWRRAPTLSINHTTRRHIPGYSNPQLHSILSSYSPTCYVHVGTATRQGWGSPILGYTHLKQ
jgi:hypothetical protein